ncbi:MAG: FG-GAP repeat domain-containing protein [Pirellulales bacterium]
MNIAIRGFALCGLLLAACHSAVAEESPAKISFKKTQLDNHFRSEGVAVADFNKDGKLDIAAGSVWYSAPDWAMHVVAEEEKTYDPLGYSNSFANFADDINGDGWADLVVVDFPGQQTWWFENPQATDGKWKRHVGTPVTNNESPQYVDIDGDGKRELLCAFSPDPKNTDGPEKQMAIITPAADPEKEWTLRAISAKNAEGCNRYSHGLGAGDINGDGRKDVVVPQGWWESPADANQAEWAFHPVNFGPAAADMHIFDYDGDGDADVLSSSAHDYGIWWHEQKADGWETHEIEKTFSQTHAMCMADINGDGLPDFVTGKRWWAHGPGGDNGRDQPAVLHWFELTRQDGKPAWIRHDIDNDSGMGTQFQLADINGDGLIDVVTSNKKGVFCFEQVRE